MVLHPELGCSQQPVHADASRDVVVEEKAPAEGRVLTATQKNTAFGVQSGRSRRPGGAGHAAAAVLVHDGRMSSYLS